MSKKKELNKLTPFEEQFIEVWFRMNFNGRLAYKQLKPDVTNNTADAEASRILSTEKAKNAIEMKREHIRMKEEVELGWLIDQLKAIILDVKAEQIERDKDGRITSKPDRKSALTAIQQLSKIGGFEAPKKQEVKITGPIDISKLVSFDDEEKE